MLTQNHKLPSYQFENYSGLDYLLIDLANHGGRDKTVYKDRLLWASNILPENLTELTDEQIAKLVRTYKEFVENDMNSAIACMIAIKDHYLNKPSGYMVSLDAVCSGTQIMSALTADIVGLNLTTGMLSNIREDAYSTVYKRFLELYGKPNNKTRKQCKKAMMTLIK